MRRLAAVALAAVGVALAQAPAPPRADPIGQAIDKTVETNRAAAQSQNRVDQLDDATRQLLERYRAAVWQAQQLEVYAGQLEKLAAQQAAEKASLQAQLAEVEVTEREILPLMLRMVDSLDKFVALDLPFLRTERAERVADLKRLLTDPEAGNAEKFRRILEAYQIEGEYGRTLGAERAEVDGRTAEVLRVGRTALFYLSLEGEDTGTWDRVQGKWLPLDDDYAREVRRGLRIARETIAADLLTLPMPAVTAAAPDTP